MTLTSDEREALIAFRIQKANDTLIEAKGIATLGFWNAVVNRLYYACFYITNALLVKSSYSSQTHRGVIRLLGLHFIMTGKLSKESGKLYSKLFELRQTGDYDDIFTLEEEDVKPLIPLAEEYIKEVSKLISTDIDL